MNLCNPFKGYLSVHDKKICHAREGGQPSIKIIRYPNQAIGGCFARCSGTEHHQKWISAFAVMTDFFVMYKGVI